NVPSFFAFLRKARQPYDHLLAALNFSDRPIDDYQLSPFSGMQYMAVFNSDSDYYGGENRGSHWGEQSEQRISLPPFSALILKALYKLNLFELLIWLYSMIKK